MAARGDDHTWPGDAVRCYFATGVRLSGIGRLTCGDVLERVDDAGVRSWWLRVFRKRHRTKAPTYDVPIPRELYQRLRARAGERPASDPLWPVVPATFRAELGRKLTAACEKAKVPRFSPHGFRRAADDRHGRAKTDPATWAALMDHSPEVAARLYRKATAADMLAAQAEISVRLDAGDVVQLDDARRRREEG
jgi:integrase